jgi:hypothetical protein
MTETIPIKKQIGLRPAGGGGHAWAGRHCAGALEGLPKLMN